MGCDIHGHFEIKVDGKWEHYSADRFLRDYSLFAKLANVRNNSLEGDYVQPIDEPRGLPEDISIVTKMDNDHYGTDGHSHSYITAEEITEVHTFHLNTCLDARFEVDHMQWGYLFGNGYEGFSKCKDGYPPEIEDLRFVFWFDN